jgi:hypothetical protein
MKHQHATIHIRVHKTFSYATIRIRVHKTFSYATIRIRVHKTFGQQFHQYQQNEQSPLTALKKRQ